MCKRVLRSRNLHIGWQYLADLLKWVCRAYCQNPLVWPQSNKKPPPCWLKLCQISNFLTELDCAMSKWPEKIIIWYARPDKASELSIQSQISWAMAEKMTISYNCFEHSKGKKIWWDNLLTFSGHLDTEGPIPVRKFDLWLSWSQQGGGSLFDHGQLSRAITLK